MPEWDEAARELEMMFQVPMPELQLPLSPDRTEGVLVFNGHLKPSVEPVVEGWLRDQLNDHGRSYRIMHLDELVSWIVQNSLMNVLRSACAEVDVPVLG